MSKRTNGQFERNPRDYYPTPEKPILRLLPMLAAGTKFIEPCAGDGALMRVLEAAGHKCVSAFDIEPQGQKGFNPVIFKRDAMNYQRPDSVAYGAYHFITNPPWKREVLHPMIEHLSLQHPTWLLFVSDWAYTDIAVGLKAVGGKKLNLLQHCRQILAVGRVKWIADSKHQSFDNAAWYLFDRHIHPYAQFTGRDV